MRWPACCILHVPMHLSLSPPICTSHCCSTVPPVCVPCRPTYLDAVVFGYIAVILSVSKLSNTACSHLDTALCVPVKCAVHTPRWCNIPSPLYSWQALLLLKMHHVDHADCLRRGVFWCSYRHAPGQYFPLRALVEEHSNLLKVGTGIVTVALEWLLKVGTGIVTATS